MFKFIAARKRSFITVAIIILVAAGLAAGLWATNLFGWRQWRVQEAQNFIGATLPADAANIQFTTRNQYTRIVWLRFSLPANTDLSPFLSQMGMTTSLKTQFSPFPAANPQEAAITWWQPTNSTTFAGLYWNSGSKVIEILNDQTDAAKQVIYLRAYALTQN